MNVELKRVETIRPYDRNPRVNDAAVESVARSIAEFGFRQPIVVDREGVVVVGHTRLKAAHKLGMTEVPVHVAGELTEAQAKAYRLADNRVAQLASWDLETLPLELADLRELGVDLSLLGWSPPELTELLGPSGTEGLTDEDEVPLPPEEAVTRPGDLWVLGEHRLLCGDSSNPDDLSRLTGGAPVQLVVTDPPYGVAVSPRSGTAMAAGTSSYGDGSAGSTTERVRPKDRPIANDELSPEAFGLVLKSWFSSISGALEPGRSFYVFGGYSNLASYPPAFEAAGLHLSQCLVWHKQHPVIGRRDFMGDFELLYYGWRRGAAHEWFGPNNVSDVWQVKKVAPQAMVHLTEKPVELARRAIGYSSRAGERVLDLFGGSGSTLVACEGTGRRGLLMELDPLYCDVIVRRWEAFSGRGAGRERAA